MAFLGGKLEPKKSFGNKLAADLGNVLESMAHQRAAEMKVQQDSKFWQSLGVGAKEAASIARQPESIQKAVLDRLEGATLGPQQQQQEQYQPTQYEPEQFQAPQPENFQPKSTYTPEQTESLKSIVNPILRNNLAAQFRQQNQEQPYSLPEQPIDQFNQTAGEQQIARQQQELSNRPQKQYQEPLRLVNPEEKKLRIKEQFDTRERNQIEADKSYQADIKSGEEAKRKLKILESMKKIVNKLSGPTWSNFTGATGTKGGWATEETGRFEKYTEDLIGKGKSVEEIRSERRKYPNTSLSPQSNKILIKEYEQRYKEQVEKADLAKTLKHYNGGQVPVDYDYVINQIEPIQAEPLKKMKF